MRIRWIKWQSAASTMSTAGIEARTAPMFLWFSFDCLVLLAFSFSVPVIVSIRWIGFILNSRFKFWRLHQRWRQYFPYCRQTQPLQKTRCHLSEGVPPVGHASAFCVSCKGPLRKTQCKNTSHKQQKLIWECASQQSQSTHATILLMKHTTGVNKKLSRIRLALKINLEPPKPWTLGFY